MRHAIDGVTRVQAPHSACKPIFMYGTVRSPTTRVHCAKVNRIETMPFIFPDSAANPAAGLVAAQIELIFTGPKQAYFALRRLCDA